MMLLNCGVGKDSWESPGLQGDPTSPFWRRSALGVLWKDDAKAETPVLWPTHAKNWLIGKDSDAGRDWGQEEKGTTEDKMVGWHHGLYGCESEWTPGVGDGQGGLACCDSRGRKELDTTELLNWTELRLLSMGSWRVGHLLSGFTFTFQFHALEKEMAIQSSVLAWRIPGMGKPSGLQPMGSHRVIYGWSDLAAAAADTPYS